MSLSVCAPSFAGFARQAFRIGMDEALDVLASVTELDLIGLRAHRSLERRHEWLSRLIHHDVTERACLANPGLAPVRLTRECDLFVVLCPWWRDLWYCNAIENWKECARFSICWIDELWISEIETLRRWLPALRRFDRVFVSIDGSEQVLSDRLGAACHLIPGGVDVDRFVPVARPPRRVVDIYSIGRRSPGIHAALHDLSSAHGLYYLFDTLHSGDSRAANPMEHRDLYAQTCQRSRLFMVAPGKWDTPHQVRGQSVLGNRYFEGAAAGAVLLGQAPQCPSFAAEFAGDEAVIPLQPDASDARAIASALLHDEQRLQAISARNMRRALLQHDWIYRWQRIFDHCGIAPTPAMEQRIARLQRLAGG